MNLDGVEKVADAVLYEGYMLYPYRPSAVKNRQRWNFGVLCPPAYCELQKGSEASMMQTEVLLRGSASTRLTVKVRFLQIVQRSIGGLRNPLSTVSVDAASEFDLVDRLEVDGRILHPWQEAVEREVASGTARLDTFIPRLSIPFHFEAGKRYEPVRNEIGRAVGVIEREWESLSGSMEIAVEQLQESISKITVQIHNLTAFSAHKDISREAAMMFSLASAHTILCVEDGEFISLIDPPPECRDLAAACTNIGTWPVLAGDEGFLRAMLSSPIILYDYPQIAPESAGNLFDGTEIDEILSLRIMTLTDDEKREMRQSDDRTRAILERTENMPEEQFMKLHGVLRELHPLKEGVQ